MVSLNTILRCHRQLFLYCTDLSLVALFCLPWTALIIVVFFITTPWYFDHPIPDDIANITVFQALLLATGLVGAACYFVGIIFIRSQTKLALLKFLFLFPWISAPWYFLYGRKKLQGILKQERDPSFRFSRKSIAACFIASATLSILFALLVPRVFVDLNQQVLLFIMFLNIAGCYTVMISLAIQSLCSRKKAKESLDGPVFHDYGYWIDEIITRSLACTIPVVLTMLFVFNDEPVALNVLIVLLWGVLYCESVFFWSHVFCGLVVDYFAHQGKLIRSRYSCPTTFQKHNQESDLTVSDDKPGTT